MAILPFLILSCKKQNNNNNEQAKEPEISVEENLATPALLKFNNVVILGNSITYAGPDGNLAWYGHWGMAASAEEKDYVHILKNSLQLRNPDVTVTATNIGDFELDPQNYDFDTRLKSFRDSQPDLLILRIGENLQANSDLNIFDKRYKDLINYFKANNPNLIVIGVSTVFQGMADDIMARYPPYVSLKTIHDNQSNFALGLFDNYAVATHPGDTGMLNIASLIWQKIKTLN